MCTTRDLTIVKLKKIIIAQKLTQKQLSAGSKHEYIRIVLRFLLLLLLQLLLSRFLMMLLSSSRLNKFILRVFRLETTFRLRRCPRTIRHLWCFALLRVTAVVRILTPYSRVSRCYLMMMIHVVNSFLSQHKLNQALGISHNFSSSCNDDYHTLSLINARAN